VCVGVGAGGGGAGKGVPETDRRGAGGGHRAQQERGTQAKQQRQNMSAFAGGVCGHERAGVKVSGPPLIKGQRHASVKRPSARGAGGEGGGSQQQIALAWRRSTAASYTIMPFIDFGCNCKNKKARSITKQKANTKAQEENKQKGGGAQQAIHLPQRGQAFCSKFASFRDTISARGRRVCLVCLFIRLVRGEG